MKPQNKYCAIYTRKSTEEGLEQEFNTLDAQRESCLAYIASQKSEGWMALEDHYDDGGYSGGNIERPALRKLIEDIKAGKVHIVVVYKIDRLTRSLMDFSKLVEIFDQYGVTFVSVTQSFNTTTSMGRLTLNVLLSFAQFEREVIGERVRDKVAASKKKGMWMGGNIPLGYDLEDKQLCVNPEEAQKVRHIFNRYLHLCSVEKLMRDLHKNNIRSKVRISEKGKQLGGSNFSRGALYHLLRNPVFIGKTKHKDKLYDGMHEAIISQDLWDKVQLKMADQSIQPRGSKKSKLGGAVLKGKLFDVEGNHYSPAYSNKNGRRYSYYISQTLIQYRRHPDGIMARLPAYDLDRAVIHAIRAKICEIMEEDSVSIEEDSLLNTIERVIVSQNRLEIQLDKNAFRHEIESSLKTRIFKDLSDVQSITIPFFVKRGQNGGIVIHAEERAAKDPLDLPPEELNRLIQGIIWRDEHFSGMSISQIARREKVSDTFVGKLLHSSLELSLQ